MPFANGINEMTCHGISPSNRRSADFSLRQGANFFSYLHTPCQRSRGMEIGLEISTVSERLTGSGWRSSYDGWHHPSQYLGRTDGLILPPFTAGRTAMRPYRR